MLLRCLPVGLFQENCYILACEDTKEAIVVDPGEEPDKIIKILQKYALNVKYIFNTHGHPDHIGANVVIKKYTQAPILIHKDDVFLLRDPLPLPFLNMPGVTAHEPDQILEGNEELTIGKIKLRILFTPGHSPGGICIHFGKGVFTGDTLFAGSIGRTDLPGGNMDALLQSIQDKLFTLPDELEIFPGHGPSSNIGREKETNPFF